MTTLRIDRETRDLIVQRVRSYETTPFESFDGTLRCGSREEVHEAQAFISWLCGLLDHLGWDDAGDADTYDLEVDDRLGKMIIRWRAEMDDDLLHALNNLRHVRAGDEGYFPIGLTQEQSIELDEQDVAEDRQQIVVVQRLIDRLQPEAVA